MSRAVEALQNRAEVLKLARMLHREPDTLAYLEELPLIELRALRDEVTEALWSADDAVFGKLAAASRLLPHSVSATISERAFGPLVTARLAGRLEPSRAVDVAAKLSTGFLADVAIELDPRRASAVIAGIPAQRIAEITAELVARGEWVTMGRFVGHLTDGALSAALHAMDNAELLRIGFVLEDKGRLDTIIALLPEPRIEGITSGAAEHDLWLEALDLLSHLNERNRRRIANNALELDPAALEDILAAVIEHELWDEVLLVAERDPALQAKLVDQLPSLPEEQRRAMAARASADGTAERLGPLGEALRDLSAA
jgi:hypothetical protein